MLDSSLQSAAGSVGACCDFFLLSWDFCQGFETSATTGDAARSYFTQVFRSVEPLPLKRPIDVFCKRFDRNLHLSLLSALHLNSSVRFVCWSIYEFAQWIVSVGPFIHPPAGTYATAVNSFWLNASSFNIHCTGRHYLNLWLAFRHKLFSRPSDGRF